MSGFPLVQLSDVADVGAGNPAPQKKELFEGGNFPFIRTSDVGQIRFGQIGSAADLLNESGIKKLRLIPKGSILMPKSGASTFLNHRVEMVVDAYVSSHLATIAAKPDKALPRYLLYYLSTIRAQDLIQDHKYPSLTLGIVSSIEVALPSLEEQMRIVAVLDKAFAALDRARALAEANLADAEELFERELTCAFARAEGLAEPRPFKKLCKALTPKTKIMRKNYLEVGHHPIVSQEANLISGYWNDESALMGLDKPVIVFGDHTRCMKYVDFDFIVGADGTKVLKPHDGIDPLYLYYGLRSFRIAEKGYARHFRFLKEATLPDLGEDEQRQLATGLQEVESKASTLRHEYEAKLDDIDDLRQSILQKAFAGELT